MQDPTDSYPGYTLTTTEEGEAYIWLAGDEQPVARLKGGNTIQIALSYMNMRQQSKKRANDYLAGVVQGLVYPFLGGEGSPTVPRLPDEPSPN
jgi:hypothetical protein